MKVFHTSLQRLEEVAAFLDAQFLPHPQKRLLDTKTQEKLAC